MFRLSLKDSRGKESITLTLVITSWLVLLGKYIVSGATIGTFGQQPPMGATEFGAAFALILAPWLHREWTEKVKKNEE